MHKGRVFLVAILALCCLGVGVEARASAITMSFSPGQTTNVAGAMTLETFNNGTLPPGYTITACSNPLGCGVLSPTSHYGAPPTGDHTDYLATGVGTISINLSTIESTFGFKGPIDDFGLYWGSIDAYNTISFWDGSTEVGSFTGAQVAAAASAAKLPVTIGTTSLFVNFFANGTTWTTIDLSSSKPNFESDNDAFGPVPEPATMALLGVGLLALALVVRRRKNATGHSQRG
jgi:hypothetical protein